MDDRNGRIYEDEAELKKKFNKMLESERKHLMEMKIPPTEVQLRRVPPRVGRNEPCPCGSGKKFKHCHLDRSTD